MAFIEEEGLLGKGLFRYLKGCLRKSLTQMYAIVNINCLTIRKHCWSLKRFPGRINLQMCIPEIANNHMNNE